MKGTIQSFSPLVMSKKLEENVKGFQATKIDATKCKKCTLFTDLPPSHNPF